MRDIKGAVRCRLIFNFGPEYGAAFLIGYFYINYSTFKGRLTGGGIEHIRFKP
ncbi:hypothetical protein D9M69_688840 [compost metagenome]